MRALRREARRLFPIGAIVVPNGKKARPRGSLDIDPGIVAAIPHLIGAQTCFLQRDFKKKRMPYWGSNLYLCPGWMDGKMKYAIT